MLIFKALTFSTNFTRHTMGTHTIPAGAKMSVVLADLNHSKQPSVVCRGQPYCACQKNIILAVPVRTCKYEFQETRRTVEIISKTFGQSVRAMFTASAYRVETQFNTK